LEDWEKFFDWVFLWIKLGICWYFFYNNPKRINFFSNFFQSVLNKGSKQEPLNSAVFSYREQDILGVFKYKEYIKINLVCNLQDNHK